MALQTAQKSFKFVPQLVKLTLARRILHFLTCFWPPSFSSFKTKSVTTEHWSDEKFLNSRTFFGYFKNLLLSNSGNLTTLSLVDCPFPWKRVRNPWQGHEYRVQDKMTSCATGAAMWQYWNDLRTTKYPKQFIYKVNSSELNTAQLTCNFANNWAH